MATVLKHCILNSNQLLNYVWIRKSSNVTTMSAWAINSYGGIENLYLSSSGCMSAIRSPDQLLIKVHAASINPIDVRMIGGYGRVLINVLRKQSGSVTSGTEFPLTVGRDFSGTVVEVGGNVSKYKVGDEVWGAIGANKPGTHAKFVVASQSEISKKPANISHIEAASIPYVAATTWAALCTVGELKEKNATGKRLLILGGSGGIGTFSIQLAKAWGMHVTVTSSTDAIDLVTSLGADTVIDYKTKKLWNELKLHEKFDYILDTVGGEYTDKSLAFLSPWKSAHLVTLVTPLLKNCDDFGTVPGLFKAALSAGVDTFKGLTSGRSVRWAIFTPNGSALDRVKQMVETEQIKPVVQETFPFSKVREGFKKVSEGHLRGKIVIDVLRDN
ncbi:reticulon-4-interacting protein 1 mitochondrial [Biomphalaria glabrata]|uniref:Reticulon-4-interacting protein 1 homolog, mitochondrial-like n=1 Tax=Biomphalaria glabrata TaxID=6526 RepID=A0A2C9M3U9_BIOGL|nr:reticulon-4-interacting protein 1 homolog, mitochondrial-like [Biomphalaria glabrata]XP_013071610.1 reticulon-4-interacting protein 1 homolog, mitochondrial-like [Biomphalaria glabrata]XP_055887375.1 reticulon-4-interacting protein 1 homolog, mitochondrial-like [Biomphalaria glabrata]KAI8758433.1 reticulon-4-interacting protein 1-like protein; mitochondrial-like [Biomphalaria glabrata]